MYTLFTDKTEVFECDLQLEGASLEKSFARLLIESPDLNLIFNGEISSSGKCKIPVKKLKGLLDENVKGKMKLEVVAEDTYFTPWEDDFTIDTSKKLTVEVKSQQESKPILEANVTTVEVKTVKNPTKSQKKQVDNTKKVDHVIMLTELFRRQGINIYNFKDNLNKVLSTFEIYTRKHPINLTEKDVIFEEVLKKLS
jgi:hypothetical protein